MVRQQRPQLENNNNNDDDSSSSLSLLQHPPRRRRRQRQEDTTTLVLQEEVPPEFASTCEEVVDQACRAIEGRLEQHHNDVRSRCHLRPKYGRRRRDYEEKIAGGGGARIMIELDGLESLFRGRQGHRQTPSGNNNNNNNLHAVQDDDRITTYCRRNSGPSALRRVALQLAGRLSYCRGDGDGSGNGGTDTNGSTVGKSTNSNNSNSMEERRGRRRQERRRRSVFVYLNTVRLALAASRELRSLKREEEWIRRRKMMMKHQHYCDTDDSGHHDDDHDNDQYEDRGSRKQKANICTVSDDSSDYYKYDRVKILSLGHEADLPEQLSSRLVKRSKKKNNIDNNNNKISADGTIVGNDNDNNDNDDTIDDDDVQCTSTETTSDDEDEHEDDDDAMIIMIQPSDYNSEYPPPGPDCSSLGAWTRIAVQASLRRIPVVLISPRFNNGNSHQQTAPPWILRDFQPPAFTWKERALPLEQQPQQQRLIQPRNHHHHRHHHRCTTTSDDDDDHDDDSERTNDDCYYFFSHLALTQTLQQQQCSTSNPITENKHGAAAGNHHHRAGGTLVSSWHVYAARKEEASVSLPILPKTKTMWKTTYHYLATVVRDSSSDYSLNQPAAASPNADLLRRIFLEFATMILPP